MGEAMSRKQVSGLLGVVAGGVWLASNYRHFEEQGFVAIAMPLVLIALGVIYLIAGRNKG